MSIFFSRRWKPYGILKSTEWWDSGILLSIMHRLKKPPNTRAWSAIFPWTPRTLRWAWASERRPSRTPHNFLWCSQITMDFSYLYKDDPDHGELRGNITWIIPDFETPAHWIHAEMICMQMGARKKPFIFVERVFVLFADEGIYNTYILDTDYESWALIMHCAEKTRSTRYLSALLLSRERELGMNVINYLRW